MTVQFRIRAHPFEKDDFIYEVFETKSDADKFWDETLLDENRVFDKVPYDVAIISYEEFCHGTWVLVSTKTVIKDE